MTLTSSTGPIFVCPRIHHIGTESLIISRLVTCILGVLQYLLQLHHLRRESSRNTVQEKSLRKKTSGFASLNCSYVLWNHVQSPAMTSQQVSLCPNVDPGRIRSDRQDFRRDSKIQLFIHLRCGFLEREREPTSNRTQQITTKKTDLNRGSDTATICSRILSEIHSWRTVSKTSTFVFTLCGIGTSTITRRSAIALVKLTSSTISSKI